MQLAFGNAACFGRLGPNGSTSRLSPSEPTIHSLRRIARNEITLILTSGGGISTCLVQVMVGLAVGATVGWHLSLDSDHNFQPNLRICTNSKSKPKEHSIHSSYSRQRIGFEQEPNTQSNSFGQNGWFNPTRPTNTSNSIQPGWTRGFIVVQSCPTRGLDNPRRTKFNPQNQHWKAT
jgi:hypothetical protein